MIALLIRAAIWLAIFAAGWACAWRSCLAWVRAGGDPFGEIYRGGVRAGRDQLRRELAGGARSIEPTAVDDWLEDAWRVE